MMKGFVVKIGHMLTALLLVGRIGGSYTGEIAMMQATNQNALLTTLGISARRWSLEPTIIAGIIAAPVLTVVGTFVALLMSGLVAITDAHPLYPSLWVYFQDIWQSFIAFDDWISYAPFVVLYRSLGFMAIIIAVSEICGRSNKHLQPRHVPKAITWAVVIGSLLILIADWGFTEMTL